MQEWFNANVLLLIVILWFIRKTKFTMLFLIQKWWIILNIKISHKRTGKILIMTIPFFWQFTIILVGSNSYAIELHLRASFMIVHCFLSTLTTKLINISIPIKLWEFSLPDNRHLWHLTECSLFLQVHFQGIVSLN